MSRSDQYIGLNERAHVWLKQNCKTVDVSITKTTKHNGQIISIEEHEYEDLLSEQYDLIKGAFNESAGNLLYYSLKDGGQAREYVQETPWSSGPMYFIALKVDEKPVEETLWTDKEIDMEVNGTIEDLEESQEEEAIETIDEFDIVSVGDANENL